jgi:hypothetical protein
MKRGCGIRDEARAMITEGTPAYSWPHALVGATGMSSGFAVPTL